MPIVSTSIEIAASPEYVREKVLAICPEDDRRLTLVQFLDFPSLPKYHKNFFTSIEPASPDKDMSPGKKMIAVIPFGKIEPTITVRLSQTPSIMVASPKHTFSSPYLVRPLSSFPI
jgi:hypothetical protein